MRIAQIIFIGVAIALEVTHAEVEAECPDETWMEVEGCSGDPVCIKMGSPIKFISWDHMQYQCDHIGGFLPELSVGLIKKIDLLLKGYDQLYGKTMLYVGVTDVTHTGSWKLVNGNEEILYVGDEEDDKKWEVVPVPGDNKDCMAKMSGSTSNEEKYINVDCEDDSMKTQVAYMCMSYKAVKE